MRKVICLLLTAALCIALFSGCNNAAPAATQAPAESTAPEPTAEPSPYHFAEGNFPKDERGLSTAHYAYNMPISTTDEVITMWTTNWTPQFIPEEGYASMSLPTYDRNLTGVNIEYSIVANENRKENFSVLRASDDMLDIMCWAAQYYGGQDTDILSEGYFANIYDYRDYAPNFFYLTANADPNDRDTYDRTFLSPTEVASMWVIYANPVVNGCCMVRGDWLDKLGIKKDDIVTWDDLFNTLTAVKTNIDTCPNPWAMYGSIDYSSAWVYTSYDTIPYVSSSTLGPYFILDGKVTFSNTTDNDKAFIQDVLHRALDADLVQPNWTSIFQGGGYVSQMDAGEVFYMFMTCNDTQNYAKTNVDPNCTWVPLGSPLRTPDQIMKVGIDVNRLLPSCSFNFSSKCENLKLAISWCDWLFSPEGGELWSYGLEGECWEYDANGNRVATELIYNNPDGLSVTWAYSLYAVYMGAMALLLYNKRNFITPETGEKSWAVAQFIIDWNHAHYIQHCAYPQGARLNDSEKDEISKVSGDLMTFIAENYMLFVTKSRSMTEWDSYINELKSIGMDRVQEIYQTAYDRYMSA